MVKLLRGWVSTGYGFLRARCPEISDEFLRSALRFHMQGRMAVVFVTAIVVLVLIPQTCQGGILITTTAFIWLIISVLIMGIPEEKEESVDQDVGARWKMRYWNWKTYPWWTFIPDIIILTV